MSTSGRDNEERVLTGHGQKPPLRWDIRVIQGHKQSADHQEHSAADGNKQAGRQDRLQPEGSHANPLFQYFPNCAQRFRQVFGLRPNGRQEPTTQESVGASPSPGTNFVLGHAFGQRHGELFDVSVSMPSAAKRSASAARSHVGRAPPTVRTIRPKPKDERGDRSRGLLPAALASWLALDTNASAPRGSPDPQAARPTTTFLVIPPKQSQRDGGQTRVEVGEYTSNPPTTKKMKKLKIAMARQATNSG